MTPSTVRVAVALCGEPNEHHWGYALQKTAGVRSGVLYPILNRMLEEGWLTSGWEDPAEVEGRPPRRYYELTEQGLRQLGAMIARAEIAAVKAPRWGVALA